MCQNKKDVSVIIPLYKGNKFCDNLLQMIESNCLYNNLYQYCNIEVIFINDYPKEKIVIDEKKRHFEAKLFSHKKNEGIHASRVYGIKLSQGTFIIMLDQDDLVKENWLYEQWNKIVSERANYCVCSGWMERFRIFQIEQLQDRINDLQYYLRVGNAIYSPGQVIIRKRNIPKEWLENILNYNGADDFLLWIIAIKKGEHFIINDSYLYYHTPERSVNSVGIEMMNQSIRESYKILSEVNILQDKELILLNDMIKKREELGAEYCMELKTYEKYRKMFVILLRWMNNRNKGYDIELFLKRNNYLSIAIYGMGYLGECLFNELQGSNINVKYGIDQNAIDFKQELSVFKIEDDLEKVDLIIVTIMEDIERIVDKIKGKVNCQVIDFAELLLRVGDYE